MSNNDKDVVVNPMKEVEKKILITPEDAQGASEFWTYFEVPMAAELKAAFENFIKNPTYENQQELKLLSVKAVGFTDHEALNDEMFKEIVEECRNVSYEMTFDKDLETTLTEDNK